MEYCFRIAIWMSLLLGFLQAKPICDPSPVDVSDINLNDLGIKLLTDEVVCAENVTFVSPMSMPINCPVEGLIAIKGGLEHAKKQCKGELIRVDETLDQLESIKGFSEMKTSLNYTRNREETRKQFAGFLKDFKDFFQRLNSKI